MRIGSPCCPPSLRNRTYFSSTSPSVVTSRRLISSQKRSSGSASSSASNTNTRLRVGAIHTRPPPSCPHAHSPPSTNFDCTTNWSPRVQTVASREIGRNGNRFWNGVTSHSAATAYWRSVGAASCTAFASRTTSAADASAVRSTGGPPTRNSPTPAATARPAPTPAYASHRRRVGARGDTGRTRASIARASTAAAARSRCARTRASRRSGLWGVVTSRPPRRGTGPGVGPAPAGRGEGVRRRSSA